MARMVRKQVYITEEQERLLKRRARERSKAEADLIREGLDWILRPEDEEARLVAWERVKEFLDERALIEAPQKPRTWTREELYDRPKHLFHR
ncbi:MAG TPA: hypothetical protein VNN10_01900 [Dehalococcoidia bacterium]|nr:hypothetical protein [Dehalococcoidia bacterium]